MTARIARQPWRVDRQVRARRTRRATFSRFLLLALSLTLPIQAQRGQDPAFPGGTNPDGSLRPTAPLTRLFTQEAYTQYEILAPGSEAFRIKYLPEEARPGATVLVNATRGGSEGSDVEVYDPRTGQPLKFTYGPAANDPETHEIRATLPIPVPVGGVGRVLIYKTYKDPRTYIMNGEDVVWVRSLSGYRLGVILPLGFALTSSNVAAQMSVTPEGQIKLAFANPSGQSNPVTIVAHKTAAKLTSAPYTDMFFDDMKTLYTLGDAGSVSVEQTYSDYRKGPAAKLDSLAYLALTDPQVVDLDTAKPLAIAQSKAGTEARLEIPITNDKQSAHLKLTGSVKGGYSVAGGMLTFDRTLKGLRNTIVLPAGWEVTSCSQSGTVGKYQGRAFVALINLNAENEYRVVIHAQRAAQ